jgi:hypothetical protein
MQPQTLDVILWIAGILIPAAIGFAIHQTWIIREMAKTVKDLKETNSKLSEELSANTRALTVLTEFLKIALANNRG